jgi:hypothetical protein
MLDILFFLLITVIFIFKLKNTFGVRNDDDKKIRDKTIEEFFKKKYGQNTKVEVIECRDVVDVTNKVKKSEEQVKSDFKFNFEITEDTKNELNKVGFNVKTFLKGAENAVEMINDAFSNKDEETLKTILETKLFSHFKQQIDDLNAQGKTLKSSLISILSNEIANVKLVDKNILITVNLKMEQINFVEDKDKKVILGSKKKIDVIQENWIFARDTKSNNNFWIVNDIENV